MANFTHWFSSIAIENFGYWLTVFGLVSFVLGVLVYDWIDDIRVRDLYKDRLNKVLRESFKKPSSNAGKSSTF